MARCEMLQARIETLEHQVEALMVSPRAHAPLFPEGFADLRPDSREHRQPDNPPETPEAPLPAEDRERRDVFRAEMPVADAALRETVERKFQPPSSDIGLLLTSGDGTARQLVETLTEILIRDGWTMRGVTEDRHHTPADGCRGLTLVAAPTLPLPRVTSTLNALRQGGFAVGFQIDPARGSSETLLIVGAGAESENGAGPKA